MENKRVYSNCQISGPVLRPNEEAVRFGGFAWSPSTGMIHESAPDNNEEGWEQWLGTQQ